MPPRRTKQELPKIHRPTSNVSAYEIGIHLFMAAGEKIRRAKMQPRNPGAKRSIWASSLPSMSNSEPFGT